MSAGRIKKRYMNLTSVIVYVLCLLLVTGNVVFAEPYLMLDASPASYDPITESILPTDPVFTLYALVNSESGKAPNPFVGGTFYISAAIVPSMPEADPGSEPDLGSFTFDGETIIVVGTGLNVMEYGSPPINAVLNKDQIAAHGVFDTYFEVFEYELDLSKKAFLYDSMVTPDGLVPNSEGTLYYEDFNVDVSNLALGYAIDFDLFNVNSDGSIKEFAPFSHDVRTPTPGAVILGMLGLGVVGLKLRKYA